MARLSVNVNKIALLRNSRGESKPDLITAAKTLLSHEIGGITVHPRSDVRHIRPRDVHDLRELLRIYPGCELNVEGNPFHPPHPEKQYPGFLELVEETEPEQVTLVPDNPHQLTSDHGWNLSHDYLRLTPIIQRLKQNPSLRSLRVSLFVNPEVKIEDLKLAKDIGADRIELYTDHYAKLYRAGRPEEGIALYRKAVESALEVGLKINAGHALSLNNLEFLLQQLPQIEEVSIGHALISEALYEGLASVVKKYLKILNSYSSN